MCPEVNDAGDTMGLQREGGVNVTYENYFRSALLCGSTQKKNHPDESEQVRDGPHEAPKKKAMAKKEPAPVDPHNP